MKNMVRKMKEYKKYKIPPQDKQLTINSLKDSVLNIKKIDLEDKKNVSILIIDDEGYDIDILSNLGYLDIDKQLAHTKISDYSRYDVIFCDINNIANEFPKQGADLAKQIKETYPEKTVVIFTGCDQNINISSYKDYVDYLIEKNADPIELVNIINRHIERKYNPIVYWENIEKEMRKKGISNKEIGLIEHFYVLSIKENNSYINNNIVKYNEKEFPTKEVIEFIKIIGNVVLTIIKLKSGE